MVGYTQTDISLLLLHWPYVGERIKAWKSNNKNQIELEESPPTLAILLASKFSTN